MQSVYRKMYFDAAKHDGSDALALVQQRHAQELQWPLPETSPTTGMIALGEYKSRTWIGALLTYCAPGGLSYG